MNDPTGLYWLKNKALNTTSILIAFCQRLLAFARGETINSHIIIETNVIIT